MAYASVYQNKPNLRWTVGSELIMNSTHDSNFSKILSNFDEFFVIYDTFDTEC